MKKYVAQPFIAGSPKAEVIGQAVLAFAENLESDLVKPLLPKHGLDKVEPDGWYSHQAWMDVLKEMNDTLGGQAQFAFVAFGRKVVEKAAMPPEIQSIPDILNALHAIHHMNLRNIPEDEGYHIEKLDEKHYQVYENTPNPTDAIYGFIWGLVARFRQENEQFTVKIVDNPNPSKQPGVVYDVTWG